MTRSGTLGAGHWSWIKRCKKSGVHTRFLKDDADGDAMPFPCYVSALVPAVSCGSC